MRWIPRRKFVPGLPAIAPEYDAERVAVPDVDRRVAIGLQLDAFTTVRSSRSETPALPSVMSRRSFSRAT